MIQTEIKQTSIWKWHLPIGAIYLQVLKIYEYCNIYYIKEFSINFSKGKSRLKQDKEKSSSCQCQGHPLIRKKELIMNGKMIIK